MGLDIIKNQKIPQSFMESGIFGKQRSGLFEDMDVFLRADVF